MMWTVWLALASEGRLHVAALGLFAIADFHGPETL
jgi:hypothetical protein